MLDSPPYPHFARNKKSEKQHKHTTTTFRPILDMQRRARAPYPHRPSVRPSGQPLGWRNARVATPFFFLFSRFRTPLSYFVHAAMYRSPTKQAGLVAMNRSGTLHSRARMHGLRGWVWGRVVMADHQPDRPQAGRTAFADAVSFRLVLLYVCTSSGSSFYFFCLVAPFIREFQSAHSRCAYVRSHLHSSLRYYTNPTLPHRPSFCGNCIIDDGFNLTHLSLLSSSLSLLPPFSFLFLRLSPPLAFTTRKEKNPSPDIRREE